MKAQIDKDGALWIERGGVLKETGCPYDNPPDSGLGSASCGDWCPLFGEPETQNDGGGFVQLCRRLLTFDEFTDER